MSNLINRLFSRLFSATFFSIPVLVPIAVFAGNTDFSTFPKEGRLFQIENQMIQKTAETFVEGKISCEPNPNAGPCRMMIRENRTGRLFAIENPEKARELMNNGKTDYRIKGMRLGSRLEILTVTALNTQGTNPTHPQNSQNSTQNEEATGG